MEEAAAAAAAAADQQAAAAAKVRQSIVDDVADHIIYMRPQLRCCLACKASDRGVMLVEALQC
eukprot:scaffold122918_cov23-Tisochrysis_lutea.AAC.1